ncbi:uncharacterized protein LOC126176844 [Schistocerca cancellata]|uniref:uncharacterized protein LOC126176844 n=1 Tax=Schistocerca cancellata TaxID=274614 RepID=UPI0021173464|nr:uncharacterized protein LOC126176844 [Schistocerca cancellata]
MSLQACHLFLLLSVTAAAAQTREETTTTSAATTPEPTATFVFIPTRCRDGYVMVAGRCRRMWTHGQQRSFLTTTAEPTPTLGGDPFFAPTTTPNPEPTIFYSRERCRDGFVRVRGRCRKLLKGTRSGSADPQPAPMSEKLLEPVVAATIGTLTTQPTGKSAERTMCPEGSRFKFGMCLTPLFVRLVTLPKHCPVGYELIGDSCRKIKGTRP